MDYATTALRYWAVVTVPQNIINRLGLAFSDIGLPSGGLTALVNATTPVDVVIDICRFNSDWELNAIPNAHMTVAVGRLASDVRQVAAVHRIINNLKEMVPISIYMEAGPSPFAPQTEAGAFTAGQTVRIFRGYITSTGFRRQENSLEFIINAVHWLRDLAFSSSLSRSSHPMNPGQTSFNAAFPDIAVTGGLSLAPHATADTIPGSFFPASVIQDDFWGWGSQAVAGPVGVGFKLGGMKEFLKQLSSLDRIYTTTEARQIFGQPLDVLNEKNWEALRALQHFEPNARYRLPDGGQEVVESGYVDGVPMAMDMTGISAVAARHVATAISLTMGRETFSSIAAHTMWDKLVGQYAPLFLFAVVPMVEKALVVPFTPGLRWDGNQKGARLFTTQDYSNFEYISQNISPLRAVMLMTGMGFNTGFDTGRDAPPSYTAFGPKYISREIENAGGLVMFKAAPRWLTELGVPFLFPSMSPPFSTAMDSANESTAAVLAAGVTSLLGLFGVPQPTITAVVAALSGSVNTGSRSLDDLLAQALAVLGILGNNALLQSGLTTIISAAIGPTRTPIASIYRTMTSLWDRYAQALYVQEKTKGRQATLTGRLRLDTAPGTVVKIETNSPDLNIAPPVCPGRICVDDGQRHLYGIVLRVSIWGDAQANRSGTSFQIGFIHDEYEETLSDTSVERHPVWSAPWWGAPLVVDRTPATDKFRHWGTSVMAPSLPS